VNHGGINTKSSVEEMSQPNSRNWVMAI